MHAVGRLFPRGDRAPAIEPVREGTLRQRIGSDPALARLARRSAHIASPAASTSRRRWRSPADERARTHGCARTWTHVGTRFLPFADAATPELPLGRLLRLSLFQVSVGMAVVLLIGTLNRVMIVELGVPAWLVAVMVSLPLVFAPFRALVGFRSDTHRSVLGWRRVPYIWMGTLLQFGGFAIMPFALIVLSGDTQRPGRSSARSARRWRSCWSAPGCTRRRPSGWRWQPTSRRRTHVRASWHCCT